LAALPLHATDGNQALRSPYVSLSTLEAEGLAWADADNGVRTAGGAVRVCYDHALELDPHLRRTFTLLLTITGAGTDAQVDGYDVDGAPDEFTDCVLASTRRMRFPSSDGGRAFVIAMIIAKSWSAW
jgi:hypothetical protein